MPIKTSGELALIADIEAEFSQSGDDNISLAAAGVDAGLDAANLRMFQFYGLSDALAPTVSTGGVNSINSSQMRVYGSVSSDGGATVTSRGFYFGTSSNYLNNAKYTVGSGTGSFNRTFTGLSGSTTYRYTAFAINSAGESVGATSTQATSAPPVAVSATYNSSGGIQYPCCGGPINWYVYFGGATGGFRSLSRSMPAGSMYNHTFGKQTATGFSWVNNYDYQYIPATSSGGSRSYYYEAEGTGSNAYVNSARQVGYGIYTVGNYTLTRLGTQRTALELRP
jgi:hypothetical protein